MTLGDDFDEASLPILSVVRYTTDEYDEVFVSLRDGASWDGSHEGHQLLAFGDTDVELIFDAAERLVGIVLRDVGEAHPSLLEIAQRAPQESLHGSSTGESRGSGER